MNEILNLLIMINLKYVFLAHSIILLKKKDKKFEKKYFELKFWLMSINNKMVN